LNFKGYDVNNDGKVDGNALAVLEIDNEGTAFGGQTSP
jgi:hypothetical protein